MTDAQLIVWLRSLKGLGWSSEAADRIEALIAERDEALEWLSASQGYIADAVFALDKQEKAEAKLTKALESLIQQTHDCEKQLTEDLHHVDFCGESEPLTKARATLAEIKGESHE